MMTSIPNAVALTSLDPGFSPTMSRSVAWVTPVLTRAPCALHSSVTSLRFMLENFPVTHTVRPASGPVTGSALSVEPRNATIHPSCTFATSKPAELGRGRSAFLSARDSNAP